jgi:hypothetical protein
MTLFETSDKLNKSHPFLLPRREMVFGQRGKKIRNLNLKVYNF